MAADQALHDKLLHTIKALADSGLPITHLLWTQGASDTMRRTSKEAYQDMFRTMLASVRRAGVTAPIYVAVEFSRVRKTRC